MKYKMICTDLDGTLLSENAELSEKNRAAMEKIKDLGIAFVPTTGRSLSEIPSEILDHPSVRYIIYSGGAGIYDKKTGAVISNTISADAAKKMLEIIKKYDVYRAVHYKGQCYVVSEDHERISEFGIFRDYVRVFNKMKKICAEEYSAAVRSGAETVAVFFKSSEDRENALTHLLEIDGIAVTASSPKNLEIVKKSSTKGETVRRLAEMLGIPEREVITVGDSKNDVSMLSLEGLTLATLNAWDEAKAVADRVICKNTEHIAEWILENIINKP